MVELNVQPNLVSLTFDSTAPTRHNELVSLGAKLRRLGIKFKHTDTNGVFIPSITIDEWMKIEELVEDWNEGPNSDITDVRYFVESYKKELAQLQARLTDTFGTKDIFGDG